MQMSEKPYEFYENLIKSTAKELTQDLKADATVVIAFKNLRFFVYSYGKNKKYCDAFAELCDDIFDALSHADLKIPEIQK